MTRNALIIEDDEPTQFLLRSIAETDGWECRHGDSFQDALDGADWADVVLLDLTLVGHSGVEMIPALRMVAPATRIVVVTGHDDAHTAALEAGADAFIAKPFEVTTVLEAMRVQVVLDLRDGVGAENLPWFSSTLAVD